MTLLLVCLCAAGSIVLPETGCIAPAESVCGYGYSMETGPACPGIGEWTGAGPWGGNLKGLAVSESDAAVVVAGCGFSMTPDAGGVWRSTDGGVTWSATELNPVPVNDLCSGGPAAPSSFYAATRTGLYVSSDNGVTWNAVAGLSSAYVIGIGVNSADSDLLIAGLSSNNGIRRSTDGGENWEEVGLSSGFMKGFACDPEHPDTMYVAMSGGDNTLYRTVDSGSTWSPIGPAGSGWGVLAAPFGTGETIIVTTSDGFYLSIDHGNSWNLVVSGSSYASASCDGSNIYAPVISAGGVYESTDQGLTWNLNTQGIGASYWQTGCCSSAGYLAGHYGGIYRTSSAGTSYSVSQQGISNGYIHAVSYTPSTGILLAGGDHHGLWKSSDDGLTWNIVLPGPADWTIYDIAPENDSVYQGQVRYVATADGVFKSLDSGESWVSAGLDGVQVTSVDFDPADPDCAWAGTASSGVHYTTDGGLNWFTGTGFPFALYPSIALIENSSGNTRVLVSFQQNGEGVYYSDDGGVSYTVSAVSGTYHPGLSSGTGEEPMAYAATDNGVYRSFDRGNSWEKCPGSTGLTWAVQGSLNSSVFGGTNGTGVNWSPDAGDTWQPLNSGIENSVVWDIEYGENSTQLFAGLRGFGVVEITDSQLGMESGVSNASALTLSVSPNPASATVKFVLSGLSEGSDCSLSVFSADGRLIHRQDASSSTIPGWSPAKEIPTGIYLVMATAGEHSAVSRLVLLH